MSQVKIHPNWYYTIGKKTQAGIVQLTSVNLSVFKGKKLEILLAFGDIQQVSKELGKKDPVVKIVDTKNQEIMLKPLLVGSNDLEPLVDQLITAIESARGNV
ncbi:MAG TPA: hypothetical protein VKM55_20085 [Candidatus Lokiarchaeia archaeon]|nr:hypothetical protein [Candidatus Lokiarchaeia archaeon]